MGGVECTKLKKTLLISTKKSLRETIGEGPVKPFTGRDNRYASTIKNHTREVFFSKQ